VETQDGRHFTVINDYLNLDMMSRALYAKASRVTKDQVLKLDKPNIIEEEVQLSKQHLELYRKLIKERVLSTGSEYFTASEAQTLRQTALKIVLNPDAYTDAKIKDNQIKEWLTEKLDSLGCEHLEKVVVFAQFNQSVEKLSQWFKHLNPALVYGKSKTQENVQKFLTDDSCRLMIAHPKSGGVGVDQLQTLCRYVIFVEPTSVPGEFTQALDRLHRRGQQHAVVCYILRVARTTWPKRVDEMRRKMKLLRDVTMDKTALLDELLGK
jgi:SNF2 family DNA or RNA helicase